MNEEMFTFRWRFSTFGKRETKKIPNFAYRFFRTLLYRPCTTFAETKVAIQSSGH